MSLADKKCVPCEVKIPPMDAETIQKNLKELKHPWIVEDDKKIKHEFKFKDFKEAIVFINKVANLAEAEGHHPNIHVFYNKVTIELWTHFIGGLSENDFIMASKIELL